MRALEAALGSGGVFGPVLFGIACVLGYALALRASRILAGAAGRTFVWPRLSRALVALAPLVGLLGTVDGMIETFDALGRQALFAQSGSVASGISRALFTTQAGLCVAIPGHLLGRWLDRKEDDDGSSRESER